jgi:ribonuclease-3
MVKIMSKVEEIFNQEYPGLWEEFQKISVKIQNIINYQFNNKEFLWNALSIRGSKLPTEKFERYEFLGDAILKATHGILLFDKSKDFSPGELTSFRRNFEKNEYLAELADELQFNKIGPILGIGKLSVNQAADCFEALIGAIFLDNGRKFDEMIGVIKSIIHFEKRIKDFLKSPWGSKDPKSFLHEWVQKKYGNDVSINYTSINEGTMNAPEYKVRILLKRKSNGKNISEGPWVEKFSKKKEGEKEAAKAILNQLMDEGTIDK